MIERLKETRSDTKIIETRAKPVFSYMSTLLDMIRSWKFMEIPAVFVNHELKLLHLSNVDWIN